MWGIQVITIILLGSAWRYTTADELQDISIQSIMKRLEILEETLQVEHEFNRQLQQEVIEKGGVIRRLKREIIGVTEKNLEVQIRLNQQDDVINKQWGLINAMEERLGEMKDTSPGGYHDELGSQSKGNASKIGQLHRVKRQLNLGSSILNHLKDQEQDSKAVSQGVVYTRWGRTKCNGDASLIYEGFTGGSYLSQGGGVNYQCMPLDPEYNRYSAGGSNGILRGTEYQSHASKLFPDTALDQNVPCARCLAPRTAHMMVPAKRTCPEGWTTEYEGYLMSQAGDQSSSTYECVDSNPEYVRGMVRNTNGATFFFIKPDCDGEGTIGHCPPYIADRQLTCTVCTR